MDEANEKPKLRRARERSPEAEPQAEAAFDLWLKRSLHQMFDTITAEPIPEELLRLIENDRNRRRG